MIFRLIIQGFLESLFSFLIATNQIDMAHLWTNGYNMDRFSIVFCYAMTVVLFLIPLVMAIMIYANRILIMDPESKFMNKYKMLVTDLQTM